MVPPAKKSEPAELACVRVYRSNNSEAVNWFNQLLLDAYAADRRSLRDWSPKYSCRTAARFADDGLVPNHPPLQLRQILRAISCDPAAREQPRLISAHATGISISIDRDVSKCRQITPAPLEQASQHKRQASGCHRRHGDGDPFRLGRLAPVDPPIRANEGTHASYS